MLTDGEAKAQNLGSTVFFLSYSPGLIIIIFVCFGGRISPHSSGCPEVLCVDQPGLKTQKSTTYLCLPKYWD